MMPPSNQSGPGGPGSKPPTPSPFRVPNWAILLLLFLLLGWFLSRAPSILAGIENPTIDVPYSFFRQQIVDNKVSTVLMQGSQVNGEFTAPVTWPPVGSPEAKQQPPVTSTDFTTTLPPVPDADL